VLGEALAAVAVIAVGLGLLRGEPAAGLVVVLGLTALRARAARRGGAGRRPPSLARAWGVSAALVLAGLATGVMLGGGAAGLLVLAAGPRAGGDPEGLGLVVATAAFPPAAWVAAWCLRETWPGREASGRAGRRGGLRAPPRSCLPPAGRPDAA
jgi:hypothetical protein